MTKKGGQKAGLSALSSPKMVQDNTYTLTLMPETYVSIENVLAEKKTFINC